MTTMNAAHLRNRFNMRDRLVSAIDRGTHRPPGQIANLIDSFSLHKLDVLARSIGEEPCSRETWCEVAAAYRTRAAAVRPPDYDHEPGCDCPRYELEIGGHGHLVDCGRERPSRRAVSAFDGRSLAARHDEKAGRS